MTRAAPSNENDRLPAADVLAYSMKDAARATGLSRSTLYCLVERGDLRTFKIGTRTLILRRVLEAFLERQAAA